MSQSLVSFIGSKVIFLFFTNLISKKSMKNFPEPLQPDGEPPICEKWRCISGTKEFEILVFAPMA